MVEYGCYTLISFYRELKILCTQQHAELKALPGFTLLHHRKLRTLLSGSEQETWEMVICAEGYQFFQIHGTEHLLSTTQNCNQRKYWKIRAIKNCELSMKLSGKRKDKWRRLILLLKYFCISMQNMLKQKSILGFFFPRRLKDFVQLDLFHIKHDKKTDKIVID